jgi:hypothetical protein
MFLQCSVSRHIKQINCGGYIILHFPLLGWMAHFISVVPVFHLEFFYFRFAYLKLLVTCFEKCLSQIVRL